MRPLSHFVRYGSLWQSGDLFPSYLLPTIANLQLPAFPLLHYYLRPRRCVMIAMVLNLQQTTSITHHPIIAERTLCFQAEDFH